MDVFESLFEGIYFEIDKALRMAASDPSTTSCQQGSADSSCPSKYQCYNQSPHGYFDSEDSQSNQCLCNRHAMFYGQDCLKTHFLAFLTFGLISILMLKCCVRFFSALEAQFIVPPRRRKGTHLVLASISFSLGCLSFLSMTLMNFLRLFTVGAGFELWFRDRGFLYFIFVSVCVFQCWGSLCFSEHIVTGCNAWGSKTKNCNTDDENSACF